VKIGIATLAASSHVWFPDQTIHEALPVLQEAGITCLEYNDQTLPAYKDLSKSEAADIRRRADDLGLVLWSAHSPCLEGDLSATDAKERRAAVELHLRCIERLGWLGISNFVVHQIAGSGDGIPVKTPYGIESTIELCEAGEECGVRILVENFVNFDSGRCREFVEGTAQGNIGIVFDVGHAHHTPLDAADEVGVCGDMLASLHVHDNHGLATGDEHLPPGQGTVAWPEVLRALRDVHYQGPFMMEVFPREAGSPEDARRFVCEAVEAARSVLA
jgi:sugar phosphate isomerase/epimerase